MVEKLYEVKIAFCEVKGQVYFSLFYYSEVLLSLSSTTF